MAVSSLKPPQKNMGFSGWLKENMFSNWWNSLLSIVCLTIIVWSLYSIGVWIFNAQGWGIVKNNLRLLSVFTYPIELLWRPFVCVMIIMGLFGVSAGVSNQGIGDIIRQSFYWIFASMIGFWLWSLISFPSVRWLWFGVVACSAVGFLLGRMIPQLSKILSWLWIASWVVCLFFLWGFGFNEGKALDSSIFRISFLGIAILVFFISQYFLRNNVQIFRVSVWIITLLFTAFLLLGYFGVIFLTPQRLSSLGFEFGLVQGNLFWWLIFSLKLIVAAVSFIGLIIFLVDWSEEKFPIVLYCASFVLILAFVEFRPWLGYWGDWLQSFAFKIQLLFQCFVAVLLGSVIAFFIPNNRRAKISFLLIGVLLSIIFLINFGDGRNDILSNVSTKLWGGIMLSFFLSVNGIVLSFPLGIALALGRQSKLPVMKWICTVYIEVIRGAPLVTWLFMASLMLPLMFDGPSILAIIRAQVAIILFAAAYMAENVRGGLQAVPKGQIEASRALGLNSFDTVRRIVLPQALRAVIPAVVGLFIGLFKDTSLVTIVGLSDLFETARKVSNQPETTQITGGVVRELFIVMSLFYWFFSYRMSVASKQLEKQLGLGTR